MAAAARRAPNGVRGFVLRGWCHSLGLLGGLRVVRCESGVCAAESALRWDLYDLYGSRVPRPAFVRRAAARRAASSASATSALTIMAGGGGGGGGLKLNSGSFTGKR